MSKTVLIQYFDSLCKDIKTNWGSTLLSSEIYGLSIGRINIITLYGKLSGVPLNILSSVFETLLSFIDPVKKK